MGPALPGVQLLAEGKSEVLPAKTLERAVKWILCNPVLPGYADIPADLTSLLIGQECLQPMAHRNPR
jgi:hypothetical protein